MEKKFSVFPLDISLQFIIHRLDMQMALGLQHAFQAKGFNITYGQYVILSRLWENEGIHQSALGRRAAKGKGTISRMLNLLEKSGFICRIPDSEDKRRLNVYLTEEGKAIKQKLIPIVIGFMKKCIDGLTQKEVQNLRKFHEHILNNLSKGPIKRGTTNIRSKIHSNRISR